MLIPGISKKYAEATKAARDVSVGAWMALSEHMNKRIPDPKERTEFAEKCRIELDNPDYRLSQLSYEAPKSRLILDTQLSGVNPLSNLILVRR
jgi:hypothetical protein